MLEQSPQDRMPFISMMYYLNSPDGMENARDVAKNVLAQSGLGDVESFTDSVVQKLKAVGALDRNTSVDNAILGNIIVATMALGYMIRYGVTKRSNIENLGEESKHGKVNNTLNTLIREENDEATNVDKLKIAMKALPEPIRGIVNTIVKNAQIVDPKQVVTLFMVATLTYAHLGWSDPKALMTPETSV